MFTHHHQSVLNLLEAAIDIPVEDKLKSPDNFHLVNQREAFRKKNLFLIDSDSADETCVKTWFDCEATNKIYNQKFRDKLFTFEEYSTLHRARLFLQRILGAFEYGDFRFTNGSTVNHRGFAANIVDKIKTAPECTRIAAADFMSLAHIDPHLFISCGLYKRDKTSVARTSTQLIPVEGNCFFTVPKNNTTSRPCCMEPLGNLLLQKSISGTLYKRFLRTYDLKNRQTIHRKMLMNPEACNLWATIDLSNASDTICLELVRFLLPSDWFFALDRARSNRTVFPDGSVIELEKFSSMGNGFTFELETIIFYALCYGVLGHHNFSVYGDDIIVPLNTALQITAILKTVGFSPNMEKSYWNGNFRESCGVDVLYSDGRAINVRPIYLKGTLSKNMTERYISLQNTVYRIATIFQDDTCIMLDSRYKPALEYLECLSDEVSIPIVPFGLDFGFYPLPGHTFKKRSIHLWPKLRKKRIPKDANVTLYAALYGIPSCGVTPRQDVISYTHKYTRTRCFNRVCVLWV